MRETKILLTQFCVGPSYKRLLLYNLQTYSGYTHYDTFIITDDVDYFNSVAFRPNLFIYDIYELRKNYPWSIEFERIPKEKNDIKSYRREIMYNKIWIPTMMERFVFTWNKVYDYDAIVFMNCDVILSNNPISHQMTKEFFEKEKLQDKIIFMPGDLNGYNEVQNIMIYAIDINDRYKITDKEIQWNFAHNDGNHRMFMFPDKSKIKPFFDLLNNITHDILVEKRYPLLGRHSRWDVHSETVFSIVLNLFDVKVLPFVGGASTAYIL